ncbi:OLC1v1012613C1 [Oldenlandia corymbosa var. corymbosa]|uniref:OLC1v1012613C1 n=1 Tax=Oldenlandia corymbosa var. corymbosa TaxID=529605 RepID=A0AAV1DWJ7_OLDCO|nr:OLC1v1012613C1 [Oldenlandia corymbosa var. corymbosa]
MARAEWANYSSNNGSGTYGRGKWCSYKRTTLIVCSVNIVVALFVLRSLYNSLYLYPYYDSTAFRYTPDQIRKMEESIRIRRESEPAELIKLVEKLKREILQEEMAVEVPESLKRKITDELLIRLSALNASSDSTARREVVESWRSVKLSEVQSVLQRKATNSTFPPEEAGLLARALGPGWAEFSEGIGLWIPLQVTHEEHDDKPEGVEEFDREILPGKRLPPECHAELHTDYDGVAVRWGLTHHKESAYECCMACLDQAKNARPDEKKCNIWVYCPSETGCFSPDIYEHKNQECWLKYDENPKLNFKDTYSDSYRSAHPNAPLVVPWVSGVVSA